MDRRPVGPLRGLGLEGIRHVVDRFSHSRLYSDAPALYQSLLDDRMDALSVRLQW